MEKIKVKQFCEEYSNRATESLKKQYLRDALKITPYVSIIKKDAYAQIIVNRSMYEQEDYVNENGETKRHSTGRIKVNSVAQYVQFCRFVIELYTNLDIGKGDFIEEYDALSSTGLMDMLIIGSDNTEPLIPVNEIREFRTILDMKVKDAITNSYEPHAFISNQVERFGTLTGTILKPVLDKIAAEIESMDEIKIEKLMKAIDKGIKRIK